MNYLSKPLRLMISLVLVWMGALWSVSVSSAATFYTYPPSPQGLIGFAAPTIELKLSYSGLEMQRYYMYLNNTAVEAQFDGKTKTFRYTPAQPLPAGSYHVKLNFQFRGYREKEYDWNFTVSASAIKSFPDITPDQTLALKAVNDYRAALGLSPVRLNERLNAAAKAHADYLQANGLLSHDETQGSRGFIGETVTDRLKYYGYVSDIVMEDISQQSNEFPADAVDGLFDAPYHRIPFMYPNVKEIGYARAGNYHVFDFGSELHPDDPVNVLSPYPGEAYVPFSWDGHELPDPLRIHDNMQYPTGYPIMLGIYGKNVKQTAIVKAELADDAGKAVPLLWNGAGNMNKDDELNTEAMVIPAQPLEPNRAYTVSMQVLVTYQDDTRNMMEKTWKFTTEKETGIGKQILHAATTNANLEKLLSDAATHRLTFSLDGSGYDLDGRRFQAILKPMVINGYSYLALRDLEKALGAKVDWDDTHKAAIFRKGQRTVVFSTLRNAYALNGQAYPTDTPARLIEYNGEPRTIIPVRLLSESLGAKVDYIDAARTVVITY